MLKVKVGINLKPQKVMNDFKVGCSPLTGKIYAGTVSKKGLWLKKQDVTNTAVGSVAQHLMQRDEIFQFQIKDKTYHLKVVEVTATP